MKSLSSTTEGKVQLVNALLGISIMIWAQDLTKTQKSSADLREILMGLSFLFIGPAIFGIPIKLYEEVKCTRKVRDFRAFFGLTPSDKEYRAVFSAFEFRANPHLTYRHHEANAKKAQPKGVIHGTAFDELTAISKMGKLFADNGVRLEIERDKYFNPRFIPDSPCLSVGLGFNNLTTELSNSSCMFKIEYRNDEKYGFTTDVLLIRPEDPEAKEFKAPACDPGFEYALVARVLYEGRPYVICAGHTGIGTIAALNYVSENWEHVIARFQSEPEPKNLREWHMAAVLHHQENSEAHKNQLEDWRFLSAGSHKVSGI
jgi:hypothetical protein